MIGNVGNGNLNTICWFRSISARPLDAITHPLCDVVTILPSQCNSKAASGYASLLTRFNSATLIDSSSQMRFSAPKQVLCTMGSTHTQDGFDYIAHGYVDFSLSNQINNVTDD